MEFDFNLKIEMKTLFGIKILFSLSFLRLYLNLNGVVSLLCIFFFTYYISTNQR